VKKLILFILMLCVGIGNSFSQDTIPNPGFENWTGASPNQPVGWGTADAINQQLSGCVTKATAASDVYCGSSSIILTSVTVSCSLCSPPSWRVAGTAVSGGQINTATPFVSGGIPYTMRPSSLNGYCKYLPQQSTTLYNGNPVGIDVSNIQVIFTKWNVTTNQRDTIGQGQLHPANSTYAAFSVPITFTTSATPDTAQIVLASSNGIETAEGSKLYVDGLFFNGTTFNCTVGIEAFSFDKFDLKQNTPNPFNGSTTIQFNCTTNEKVNFDVFDMLGREMYSDKINAESGVNIITYTSKLESGTYFYSISNGKNRITKRMIVAD
jgi:hypothetical protein